MDPSLSHVFSLPFPTAKQLVCINDAPPELECSPFPAVPGVSADTWRGLTLQSKCQLQV